MVDKAWAVWALAAGLVLGCGADVSAPPGSAAALRAAPPSTSGVAAPVVAHIDGAAIGRAEVERLCALTGLSPRAALERLIAERLLVAHAAAQGYGELPAVERAVTQARVRALLASTIEARTGAGSVEEQKAKLAQLLSGLAQATKVTYDEAAIQRAFASQKR
jgi:hypothetical protein